MPDTRMINSDRGQEVMQVSRIGQATGADGSPPGAAAPDGPRGLLHVAGQELEARGLVVVPGSDPYGVPSHIEVSNPGFPERGTVSVGWDGFLIWERWGPTEGAASADAIANIVVGVLAVDAKPGSPFRESAGPR